MVIKGKKILILGAGTWQVPYIIKAKSLGFYVLVTDWSSNAIGKKYADSFEVIDLRDKISTFEYAKKNNIDAIFTSADIGVQTAAFVANKLGLPFHSEELAYNATNKFAMREKARDIGLKIPKYKLVDTLTDAQMSAIQIGYPLIIKPVDNFSSRGVCVLFNEKELNNFFDKSLSVSFTGKVLLEEFMTGIEGSVEAIVQNGVPYIMGVCSKTKSELPFRYDLQLDYPGNFTNKQFENINNFILKLVNGFEILNGILHVEIMVTEDDVSLIEFAIRGCGSLVTTHLMPAITGFDAMGFLLLNSMGYTKEIKFCKKEFGILKFIMLPFGEIKQFRGVEDVRKIHGVLEFDLECKQGTKIGPIEDGRSRPGYLLANAKSKEKLNKIVDKALNTFNVDYF